MKRFLSHRLAAAGLILLGCFALVALLGPFVVGDPTDFVAKPFAGPSAAHWLGTTGQGQDVLAQTVVGARLTLLVGVITGALVVGMGALVGGAAGYFGGRTDDALGLLINVFLVLPGLPLMVVVAAWLPPGPVTMTAVLALTGWSWNARVLRSRVLQLRRMDFVAAAEVAGEPPWRIVVVEILPNMAPLLGSAFIGATVYAIGAQVGLEFLGLGDLSLTTWGTNLYWAANDSALLTGSWWTFVPTGVCLALVGFGLALVGFGLDELGNPQLAATRHPVLAGAPKATPHIGARVSGGAIEDPPLLSIEDLSVAYLGPKGPLPAVRGLSLDIRPGEILGLVGESGSGKSTALRGATRTLAAPGVLTGGRVRWKGQSVTDWDEARLRKWWWRQVSLVPQSAMSALNPVLTIGAHFADTLAAHGRAAEAPQRTARLLEMVGIDPVHAGSYPHQLSGGMRQRVALALALVLDPALVIMDEPTTALDVVVEREILQRLVALQRTQGFAVVFITHDIELLLSVADRVGVLYAGRLVELAPAETLRRGGVHPYTRALLASMPRLDGATEPQSIAGAPPALDAPPSGCRFHPRCGLATQACRQTDPMLRPFDIDHQVACGEVQP